MESNKVLIVDDAEINREILKEIFQEQYYRDTVLFQKYISGTVFYSHG